MSRVFEALTTAVCEKQISAKPEVSGTASEDDLIARFPPALRTEPAFTGVPLPLDSPTTNEETPQPDESETDPGHHEFVVREHQRYSEDHRDFHFKREWVAALLAAVVLIILYLNMPADYAIQKRANSANTSSNSRQQNLPAIQISDGSRLQSTGTRAAESELRHYVANDRLQISGKLDPIAPPVESGNTNKTWSVQVSATTSKETADELAQQLKSKGYAVYLLQAEVKGQTYHRVRIGPFSAREEAEPVRKLLTRHEAYRDAYLAKD